MLCSLLKGWAYASFGRVRWYSNLNGIPAEDVLECTLDIDV